MIPAKLSQWTLWADRLSTSSLYYKADFERAAAEMPEAVIDLLGDLYRQAQHDGHIAELNAWLASVRDAPMGEAEKGIRNLLRLFHYISQRGYEPFRRRTLRGDLLIEPKPDWSKLPPDLMFLAAPAMTAQKFPPAFIEIGRDEIAACATAEERAELANVAEQARRAGWPKIRDWYSQLGLREHVEASLVFNLMGVLDALALKYYDEV